MCIYININILLNLIIITRKINELEYKQESRTYDGRKQSCILPGAKTILLPANLTEAFKCLVTHAIL